MIIASLLLPLMMQVGPDPASGGVPDHSALVQDRPPQNAQDAQPEQSWLSRCFALIDEDPARAHVQAQVERERTAGDERVLANHCLGLAATKLERWREAEAAFLAARDEITEGDMRLRARMGAMAANAAMAMDEDQRALLLLDSALVDARASSAGDITAFILVDRARALVDIGQLEDAELSLAEARILRPDDGEARLLSATLLRRLGKLGQAQKQIEEAATIDPLNPQVGLEAGVIAVLDNRDDAARESWQSVLEIAPDSAEAQVARDYLEQLGPA
jgi:tetratricopeptide (TPR) repeat protein